MKKNLFLKLLAMTLAFMLVIGCTGIASLAEEVKPDENGDLIVVDKTVTYDGDIEGKVVVEATEGNTADLTLNGDATDSIIYYGSVVTVEANDGSATLKVGDITEKSDEEVSYNQGYAASIKTNGEDSEIEATIADVTSDSYGINVNNGGGDIDLTVDSINAEQSGLSVSTISTKIDKEETITEEEFKKAIPEGYSPEYTWSFPDQDDKNIIYQKQSLYVEGEFAGYTYKKTTNVPVVGTTTININNGVTVKNVSEEEGFYTSAYGVNSYNNGDEQDVNLTITGSIDVETSGGATGVALSNSNATITGDITTKADWSADGVRLSTYDHKNEVTYTGKIDVKGGKYATGVDVTSYNGGESTFKMKGENNEIIVKNEEPEESEEDSSTSATAVGLYVGAYDEGTSSVEMEGNITASGYEVTGVQLTAGYGSRTDTIFVDPPEDEEEGSEDQPEEEKETKEPEVATAKATITGDVTADGKDAKALAVAAFNYGEAVATITGDVTATGDGAIGIETYNDGGDISITAEGNITSDTLGLSLADTKYKLYTRYEGEITVDEDEYMEERLINGELYKVYYHSDGDTKVYYATHADAGWPEGMIEYKWTGEGEDAYHLAGDTRVEVIGDVTAAEGGIFVDLTNDESTMDVIVDGTVSGKTQSILVSEETIADNLTLTIWEVKANDAGNLVERKTADGKTKADEELEKKIQYIIKIEPTQTDIISTDAKDYEGYKVAKEGETVTMKLNVPKGYKIVSAFNGTDTKVQLTKDAAGNYFLIVPRGGAVMLSVELAKADGTAKVFTLLNVTDKTGDAKIMFYSDGTYKAVIKDNGTDEGTYKLENDQIVLTSKDGKTMPMTKSGDIWNLSFTGGKDAKTYEFEIPDEKVQKLIEALKK